MNRILLILIIAFAFVSCEKVIDLELNDSNQQTVIDGYITDSLGFNSIRLSKTGSFYDSDGLEFISDAEVKIIAEDGTISELTHVEDGYYTNPTLKAINGKKYKLEVKHQGETITSVSETPTAVYIDSLTYEAMSFAPPDYEDPHMLTVWFHDTPNEDNYYRIRLNSSSGLEENFLVTDDKFFEGIQASIGIAFVEPGDTVNLEIYCIDKANYDFFATVSDASSTDTPGNPVYNIEGKNAIGYFGSYASSFESIVIEKK
jgi:hypothetical protein